ncbi:unnamed protein product [Rangifer tarandus platyrhynchus]|uniref:Uncharacterized protein n=1 Tax=Rangifer tarandus platyrhynchus TaxID=3082113 RepID=A0AC59Y2U6_RANTA
MARHLSESVTDCPALVQSPGNCSRMTKRRPGELSGLCPNLYLVQLPRFPRRSWAGALRQPAFTPRRFVLVTSFPCAGQWGAAGAGVFLRMGFVPNQFKFSPALVPSSPGELESLRPSPGGWRQGGPSVEGAGDTRGDLSDVAGPLTSELQAWSFRPRPSLLISRGQEIEA